MKILKPLMINQITHIYAPSPGGVADYVDVSLHWDSDAAKFPLSRKSALDNRLPEHCLLHFSGYGFAKRGAPLWLLNKIQTDRPHIKTLGIFFHELYAFGPPSGSAFWLSPVQRHIARRLASLSDFWITNSEASAHWLCRTADNKPHAVLPVFSNVGETSAYSPQRAQKIIVFGGSALRAKTYRSAGEALFIWAQEQGLVIYDIGPTIQDPEISTLLQRKGVIQFGHLAPEAVSTHLTDAMFGLASYQADCVAKSGVFAAFCAHGVCPVLISKNYEPADELIANQHYLAGIPRLALQVNALQDISSQAWNWYQRHKVSAHVTTLHSLVNGAGYA
ncbi:hypothetical protein ACVBEF_13435 [Glaciimonas sp. GG7]